MMAQMPQASSKPDSDVNSTSNYTRLQLLVYKTNDILRQLFVTEWDSVNTDKWKDSVSNRTDFINGQGKELYKKSQRIQKEYLRSRHIKDWDLPLLISCLKTLTANAPYKIFYQLKDIRNKLAHLGELKIDDKNYEKYWIDISTLLLQLNLPQEEIDEVKTRPIEANTTIQTPILDTRVKELKDFGNEAFKNEKFEESIDFYTQAICTPDVPNKDLAILYSNRSVAFLKLGDVESAKEDAKGSIHLFPTWWKGYSRLAMAYKASEKYQLALKNLLLAQRFHDKPNELDDQINLCKRLINQQSREEHFDPMYFCRTYDEMSKMIPNSDPEFLQENDNFWMKFTGGHGMCTQGHNYYFGRGVQQDYKEAAKWYGKAAAEGNAEGLYNLGQMYLNGKGVECNFIKGISLLEQAASQESLKKLMNLILIPNLGVSEAQHSLGMIYEEGTGVRQNFEKAVAWYTRAIKNWSGCSANNLGILYSKGSGVPQSYALAVECRKLGAAMGTVRCMENLVDYYFQVGDFENMQRWYLCAVEHGSVVLKLSLSNYQDHFRDTITQSFKKEEFISSLWREVENGPLKHLIVPEIRAAHEKMKNFASTGNPLSGMGFEAVHKIDSSTAESYRKSIVLAHRDTFKAAASRRGGKPVVVGNKANLKPKPVMDLFNLKPISLLEMSQNKKDHIYEGFVLKLTVIEDPIDKSSETSSIRVLVHDEQKSYERLFIYNYNPSKEDLQENLGFGAKISIVNPYYRITRDGSPAIRVDDFNSVFMHSKKNDNKCRYCGLESDKKPAVQCRTCKRCYYCSKKCLNLDASELKHNLVCKKRI